MVPVMPRSRSAAASSSICERVARRGLGLYRLAHGGDAGVLLVGGAGGVERRAKVERAEQFALGDLVVGHGVALGLERVPVARDG